MMRILFIAPFGACHKQTVSRRMMPLAAAFVRRGHEVMLLIPAWDCPQQAGQTWRQQGVLCVAPPRGPAPHPIADPVLYQRCWRQGWAFAPDVVHVFKGLGYCGLLGYRFHRHHTSVFVDVDDLESIQGWGRRRPWPLRWWGSQQERAMLTQAQGVTVASLTLEAGVGRWRGWGDDILYLPNGVECADAPAPVATNPPVVLLYTRGNDVEPQRLCTIWRQVLARVPDARLRVVGDWKDVPTLPQMQVLGWLTGADLTDALRGSAVALFPVQDTPLVRAKSPARLLDCLGQGLPVVTEDVGEYALLVGHGQFVVAEDTGGLADDVIDLLCHADKRRLRSEISWRQAQRYNWTGLADGVLEWYKHIRGRDS